MKMAAEIIGDFIVVTCLFAIIGGCAYEWHDAAMKGEIYYKPRKCCCE